jgi:hypothetical protein
MASLMDVGHVALEEASNFVAEHIREFFGYRATLYRQDPARV